MNLFFLPFVVLSVQALKLPKVTVNATILNKYGVHGDVNLPDYFDALSKFRTYLETRGSNAIPDYILKAVDQSLMTQPIAPQTASLINMAAFFQAKELLECVTAHSLNIWERFRSTAATLNILAHNKFTYLRNASNLTIINECRSDRMLVSLAHNPMEQFDPLVACDRFLETVRQNPDEIAIRDRASSAAQISLSKVQEMVENGDKHSLKEMQTFLENNPIIDSELINVFTELLKENLKDYSESLKELISDPTIAPFVKTLVQRFSDFTGSQTKPTATAAN